VSRISVASMFSRHAVSTFLGAGAPPMQDLLPRPVHRPAATPELTVFQFSYETGRSRHGEQCMSATSRR
jgi:hypothetical protein